MKSIVKKAVTGLVAGASLIGAVAATPAEARWHGGGGHYYGGHGYGGYRGWGPGAALGAGIVGLAVGAAIASPHYGYDRGYDYPPPGYYRGGYGGGYGYGYARCRSTSVWDPYIGQYVQSQTCY